MLVSERDTGSIDDGAAAPGNPFDSPVWSMGHRNVHGLGWTADGRLHASELGDKSWDELNLIEPGANYGWPQVEAREGSPSGDLYVITHNTDGRGEPREGDDHVYRLTVE